MRTRSHFARLFPPPRYIELPSAGVDISDSSVKYVVLDAHHHWFSLAKWGDKSVPEGIIQNGIVKDVPALGNVLSEIKDEVRTPFIRVSLPEEHAYLFETNTPPHASREEIRSTIEFHLEENVPLSPRDAIFDFIEVPNADPEIKTTPKVSVTAYNRETITAYYEACVLAGTIPLSFEIEPEAITRAVTRSGNTDTVLILDFGKSRTGVGIAHNGVLLFTSTVDVGGKELDASLMSLFQSADAAELIRLKNEIGVRGTHNMPAVRDALMHPLGALGQEVKSRISYWNTKNTAAPILRVILCGGIANLAGLPEFFSNEFSIPVVQADVWQNVFPPNTVPPITKRYSYGYATAIGLALGAYS